MNETYVKMCDCPEVQGDWEPKFGDLIYRPREKVFDILIGSALDIDWLRKNCIYSPRQLDIQGMLYETGDYPTFYSMLCNLQSYLQQTLSGHSGEDPTAHESWLLFYMEAAHNKTWTEKGWA